MDNDIILRKLRQQENPKILFTDIDGTLFSPNLNILSAPITNLQTAAYLKKNHIPFIIVTGRSFWRRIDRYHLKLLGVPKPDAVVTANGTNIYYLERNGYVNDFVWQGIMQSTKVVDRNGAMHSWNKWEITDTIVYYLKENHAYFHLGRGNTYLIRIRFSACPTTTIEQIRKDILHLFPKGIRIILTEKLLWKNTLDIFSGEMLITPSTAGKDKAIQYLLKSITAQLQKPIHVFVFGDATVDVPMLTMKEVSQLYTLSQYAVHPTPMARKLAEENQKINPNLHILFGDGPKEILWTLRPELRRIPSTSVHFALDKNKFSPAQNNNARKIVRMFEKVLDKLVDKNLSPNEVSFLGLRKLSHGLSLLHKKNGSIFERTRGLYHYSFGNLTDVLDGIRARQGNKKEENGQLVDGFSDRAKEFMQLFHRAKFRMKYDKNLALTTFLASISCTLPSIARAQVEISGQVVAERDEKGGSMIDRTRRLFLSLILSTLGLEDQSFAKDLEIYTTNVATFQHRHSFAKKFDGKNIHLKGLPKFQQSAIERFLLYVDILQQENGVIIKYLSKDHKLLKDYKEESLGFAKEYLQLPTATLRKKLGIKDYKLLIKDYL